MSGPGAGRVGHRLDPFWAAIIEFFSLHPPLREKSVLSINQFSEFARGVGRQSVLSNIRLFRNSFRLMLALRVKWKGVGARCCRGPMRGHGVPAPQGRANQSMESGGRPSGSGCCVGSRLHAVISEISMSRIACLTSRHLLRCLAHYIFCYLRGP